MATLAGGLVLVMAGALTGCATRNAIVDNTATAVQVAPQLPAPNPREVSGGVQSVYYIGPQDKLEITVVNLQEATRTVVVDPAGTIDIPHVGPLVAAGKTPLEVKDEIARRLSVNVLERPDVTVAVAETASQRITLEGAVTTPGVYPVSGQLTLLRAIAMANGTNNVANEKVIVVFRRIESRTMAAVFNLQMIRDGRMADPAIFGNDVIVVERSRGKTILRDLTATIPLLGVFNTVDRVVLD